MVRRRCTSVQVKLTALPLAATVSKTVGASSVSALRLRIHAISTVYAQQQDGRGRSGSAWTGSWTGSPDNPSAASAICAISRAIGATSACAAGARAPRNA